MFKALKALLPLSLLLRSALSAPPINGEISGLLSEAQTVFSNGKKTTQNAIGKIETWMENGREFIRQQGVTYLKATNPSLPSTYQLRINPVSPTLCDSTVKQHSGYFDVASDKHLFYWFFESRNSPETAPLLLWLNGGPGCSSSTGLLFELGPCSIDKEGEGVKFNNYSWTEHANIIFLDQPVNVGFSYSDDGSSPNNTPDSAVDVWAFLELFLQEYPQYSSLPFHIAAESYGGIYGPNIASVIHKKNKELSLAQTPSLIHINLASLVLANGLTEPKTQMAAIPDYACDGPYPVWDDPNGPECQALRGKVPVCERLLQACYDYDSKWTCVPAAMYCWSQMYGSFQQLGLNPYDVRKTCDRQKDGALCYRQMGWVDTWLNKPEVKEELGVPADLTFQSCNMEINQAFMLAGDSAHNHASLLPPILQDGVRLLVYAGNADFMCNYIGNEAWLAKLEGHPYVAEFSNAAASKWVTLKSGKTAGVVRTAGASTTGAGNYTFVAVHEAGHMVPFDQPEAASDLIGRWLTNTPLTLKSNASTEVDA